MIVSKPEFPLGYYQGIDFYLWIISIIICFISLAVFLKRTKKADHESQKALFRGIGVLFLFLGLMRLTYLYGVKAEGVDYDFWIILGYICGLTGMGWFLLEMEKTFLKKTKFFFTIINIIALIFAFLGLLRILDRQIPLNIVSLVSTADMVFIFIIYIYFIFISPGQLKKRGITNLIGMILIFSGITVDSELFFIILWPTMPLWLPPILTIAGNIVILIYQKLL